ncbi:MAG: hypothetical protein Q9183_004360 [Haloplaca sp. 2 TL-2023]
MQLSILYQGAGWSMKVIWTHDDKIRIRIRRGQRTDQDLYPHDQLSEQRLINIFLNLQASLGFDITSYADTYTSPLQRSAWLRYTRSLSASEAMGHKLHIESITDSSIQTSSSTSTATPPKHPFERRLEDVKLSKA